VIKERYLKDRDCVSTQQLYRASLITPGEMRAADEEVWHKSLAEGARLGVFGLGEDDGYQAKCRSWKEGVVVSLSEGEVIIREEICKEQLAPTVEKEPMPAEPGLVTRETGEVAVGAVRDDVVEDGGMESLRLRFLVPKGKVSSLMGLLNFLQLKFDRMGLELSVEDGAISERDYEEKVIETFRQIGVDVDKAQ